MTTTYDASSTARKMADALEMRRANGGEVASFATTPEKLRAYADKRDAINN